MWDGMPYCKRGVPSRSLWEDRLNFHFAMVIS